MNPIDANNPKTEILGNSKGRIIKQKIGINLNSIECINSINIKATNTQKFAFSSDNGNTWKSFNNGLWYEIDASNYLNLSNNGMTSDIINSLTKDQLHEITSGAKIISIAYTLHLTDSMDEYGMNVDMKGHWRINYQESVWTAEYANSNSLIMSIYANGDYKINY